MHCFWVPLFKLVFLLASHPSIFIPFHKTLLLEHQEAKSLKQTKGKRQGQGKPGNTPTLIITLIPFVTLTRGLILKFLENRRKVCSYFES